MRFPVHAFTGSFFLTEGNQKTWKCGKKNCYIQNKQKIQ